MTAGEPIVWRNPDIPERDPNYPGNPDPSDPIPVYHGNLDSAGSPEHIRYLEVLDAWMARHPEFVPDPGFS